MERLDEAIDNILRLRSVERRADARTRQEIAAAREFLEESVGATVRPASAARLLGVSQGALSRWLDNGEIASVLTPLGKREVPLQELLSLVKDVRRERDEHGSKRPLAAVIRGRRRAAESIDVDGLLGRHRRRTHREPELQSLAYHRLVAERLDEDLLDDARRRLELWRREGRIHPRCAEAWERVLEQPRARVARAISADTARARQLRQTSPFAGALTEQERRRLVRGVEERV